MKSNFELGIQALRDCISGAYDSGEQNLWRDGTADNVDAHIYTQHMSRGWQLALSMIEQAGLPAMLHDVKQIQAEYLQTPHAVNVVDGEPYLKWPQKLDEIRSVIAAITGTNEIAPSASEVEYQDLLNVLGKCDMYLCDGKVFKPPANEGEVHHRLEALLRPMFTGVRPKPPIPKPIKHFIPDTGIDSLNVYIEYKYITSLNDAKKILDQIYADCSGYTTDGNSRLLFVIYETGRYVHQSDWDRALEEGGVSDFAQAVVVRGVPPA